MQSVALPKKILSYWHSTEKIISGTVTSSDVQDDPFD